MIFVLFAELHFTINLIGKNLYRIKVLISLPLLAQQMIAACWKVNQHLILFVMLWRQNDFNLDSIPQKVKTIIDQ